MSAYLPVVKTKDVRVSTGWSPLTCVSSVTEPKKPELRTLYQTQTDIIIEETWIEVKWTNRLVIIELCFTELLYLFLDYVFLYSKIYPLLGTLNYTVSAYEFG